MTATENLTALDPTKSIVPFGDGTNHQFSHSDLLGMSDPTGISVEEGDFLYGLVRILRPLKCLETGTNIAVSASFICLALRDNGVGHLTTIEHDGTVSAIANRKLSEMGFSNFTVFTGEVSDFKEDSALDFLWLDSELNQRYTELLRFFPSMNPGAVACIHDLWGLDFDQFGGVPDELRSLIKSGELRAMTFKTTHGVTVFQKRRGEDALADISK